MSAHIEKQESLEFGRRFYFILTELDLRAFLKKDPRNSNKEEQTSEICSLFILNKFYSHDSRL